MVHLRTSLTPVIRLLSLAVLISAFAEFGYAQQKSIPLNSQSPSNSRPARLVTTPIAAVSMGAAQNTGLFEIAPLVGFMGGSPLLGVRASMNYYGFALEGSIDQVIGRYATLYPITLNLVLSLAQTRRVIPFGVIGGGLFLTKPENTVGDKVISTVGVNFGGGIRFYLTPKFGLRFETKQYFTEVDNKRENHKELLIYQSSSLGVLFAFI